MPRRPTNVVFILSDDQGCWALGAAGNPEIRTPHLDRLAREGMRFENFFCTSPVCSPARASLLTGRIPSQHGVHDWIRGGNSGAGRIEYLAGQRAYTDALAEAGYVCGLVGKWHLGASDVPQKGHSCWQVTPQGGGSYLDPKLVGPDGVVFTEKSYLTDLITDRAVDFIGRESDGRRPFCLGVNFTAPHSPHLDQHPREIVESYDACAFASCPQEPRHPWAEEFPIDMQFSRSLSSDPGRDWPAREYLKGYFAAVTAMDLGVGRILAALDERGLREDTLVVFSSDNGFSCGLHGVWGKGNATFPLNLYDTSVKVPAIFSQPGRIPVGRVSPALVSGYDFAPTLLDWLGRPGALPGELPGRSFLPVLEGRENAARDLVTVFDEYGPARMIRTAGWKYVHRYPYGPHELYDLGSDPEERRNLLSGGGSAAASSGASDCEETVRDLRARLEDWFAGHVDPRRDGVREPVAGRGQDCLAGLASRGRRASHAREGDGYGGAKA